MNLQKIRIEIRGNQCNDGGTKSQNSLQIYNGHNDAGEAGYIRHRMCTGILIQTEHGWQMKRDDLILDQDSAAEAKGSDLKKTEKRGKSCDVLLF